MSSWLTGEFSLRMCYPMAGRETPGTHPILGFHQGVVQEDGLLLRLHQLVPLAP